MLQHAGMQFVREIPDRLRQRRRALLQRRDRAVDVRLRLACRPALEAAQHDGQPGELLAQVVVQVACDARALRFLRVIRPAGEILVLLLASCSSAR